MYNITVLIRIVHFEEVNFLNSVTVDFKSRKPLCDQLVDNFSDMIFNGMIAPGDQMPSVRSLAADLAINPNTIQKAYTELERRGIIYSIPGRGSFAEQELSELIDKYKSDAKRQITEALKNGFSAGMTVSEIQAVISDVSKELINANE